MGPYGGENFKPLLLLQIAAESFQTSNEFIALFDYSQAAGYSMGLMESHTLCFFFNQTFSKNSL